MVKIVFVHDHECAMKGQTSDCYPNIHDGSYDVPVRLCVETQKPLSIQKTVVS